MYKWYYSKFKYIQKYNKIIWFNSIWIILINCELNMLSKYIYKLIRFLKLVVIKLLDTYLYKMNNVVYKILRKHLNIMKYI